MNRGEFFDHVRHAPFPGRLAQSHVDGCNAILDVCEHRGVIDTRWIAYILATAFHETAHTMKPIEEYGKGRGKAYGEPAGPDHRCYYGRGFVQLTWLANYERAEKELGLPFVRNPDLALVNGPAAQIIVRGMVEGWFSGKKLADYFSARRTWWNSARRIVNGTDRAAMIGRYAQQFHTALEAAK